MPNTYIISTGEFLDAKGDLVCKCYSGHPPHVNDVAAVNIKNVGPLPPGTYKILPAMTHPHLGPLAMPLQPQPDPEVGLDWLHGRSEFYIHADRIDCKEHPLEASDGCIIPLAGEYADWVYRQRIAVLRWTDDILNVILWNNNVTTKVLPVPSSTTSVSVVSSTPAPVQAMFTVPVPAMELALAA